MVDVASRYNSGGVLIIDLGNMRPRDLVDQAFTLSRATQVQFARAMGIHRVTLGRYLSGASQPSQLVARAAIFTAVCFGISVRIQRPSLVLGGEA
jgi:Helix-turn-helix